MGCADGLSQSPHMDPPMQEEEDGDDEFIGHIQDGQIDMEEIRLAQMGDEVLQEVKQWVEGPPPNKQDIRGCPKATTTITNVSNLSTSMRGDF